MCEELCENEQNPIDNNEPLDSQLQFRGYVSVKPQVSTLERPTWNIYLKTSKMQPQSSKLLHQLQHCSNEAAGRQIAGRNIVRGRLVN